MQKQGIIDLAAMVYGPADEATLGRIKNSATEHPNAKLSSTSADSPRRSGQTHGLDSFPVHVNDLRGSYWPRSGEIIVLRGAETGLAIAPSSTVDTTSRKYNRC